MKSNTGNTKFKGDFFFQNSVMTHKTVTVDRQRIYAPCSSVEDVIFTAFTATLFHKPHILNSYFPLPLPCSHHMDVAGYLTSPCPMCFRTSPGPLQWGSEAFHFISISIQRGCIQRIMMPAPNPLVGLFMSVLFFPVIKHAVWGSPHGFGQFTARLNFMARNINSYLHVCPHPQKELIFFGNEALNLNNNKFILRV